MGKLTLIIVSLVTWLLTANAQDTIPNMGFERWDFFGNYEDPQGWGTLNSVTSFLNALTVTKATATSDVQTGSYALRMETLQTSIQIAPAVVTTGFINTITQTIDGGAPFTARPVSLNGWYKYLPVNSDVASVEISLFKWNSNTQSRDTIGRGRFEQTATVSTYSEFSITIDYLSSDLPDTTVITMLSSPNTSPQVGSILFIDDLSFQFNATGIDNNFENQDLQQFTISPNPAIDLFIIACHLNNDSRITVEIFQPDGKVKAYLTSELPLGESNIQISAIDLELSSGIYLVRISNGNSSSIKKLVKF